MFSFLKELIARFPLFSDNKTKLSAESWLYEHATSPEHIELGLERCQQVLQSLDLHKPDYKIITVAGTNGKGSTVHFIDKLLRSSSYSVGRFTSPHLRRFSERIVIDGQEQEDEDIVEVFEIIRKSAKAVGLTYFEYTCIAALYLFAQAGIDVAVLEVGLGGRLDAVNAVDADVAVITSIALDHQEWLGADLQQIGREKAGIMRAGHPVILAETGMPESVYSVAGDLGASIVEINKHYSIHDDSGFVWTAADRKYHIEAGHAFPEYQKRNVAAAIAAILSAKLNLDTKAVKHLLHGDGPKARQQMLTVSGQGWYLDVAHNPASMQELSKALNSLQVSTGTFPVVFGMLADKDVSKCIEILDRHVAVWHVAPVNSPRSLDAVQLRHLLGTGRTVHMFTSISQACQSALDYVHGLDKAHKPVPIVVCGSFYTIAEAMQHLNID